MNSRLKTIFAALGAALAGCVIGGRTIYHVDDPFVFFAHAASHGGIAVMVVGEPYPNKRDLVAGAIVAAFERTFKSLGTPFRIAEPSADPVSKIVVLFDTANNISAQTVCADPSKIASRKPGTGLRTSVRALYRRALFRVYDVVLRAVVARRAEIRRADGSACALSRASRTQSRTAALILARIRFYWLEPSYRRVVIPFWARHFYVPTGVGNS